MGPSEEGPDPSKGPSWAKAESSDDPGSVGGEVAGFKLLYAGTADKAMMLELEADEAGCCQKASDRNKGQCVCRILSPCTSSTQVSEKELMEAMILAQGHVASLVKTQRELAAEIGRSDRRVQVLGSTAEAEALVQVGCMRLNDRVHKTHGCTK